MADSPNQLNVQLYSKIAAALSVSGRVDQELSKLLSLHMPGLYIRSNLDSNNPETRYYIANALDAVLACSWTAVRQSGTVSGIYKSILDGKETPVISLEPSQREKLDAANAYLFTAGGEPSEAYRAYMDSRRAYFEALDNYKASVVTKKNVPVQIPAERTEALKQAEEAWRQREKKDYIPGRTEALEKAEEAWRQRGNKDAVDAALAVVAVFESLDPAIFWKRLLERYAKYTETAGTHSEFQFVTSDPPYELWFQESGWSDFTFDTTDLKNQNQSDGVGVESARCCTCSSTTMRPSPTFIGPFSVATGHSGDAIGFVPEGFALTCRLRRIEIVRPWLDTNVFTNRSWRWSPASVSFGNSISSGGDIAGRVLPTGVMPVLPMTALLAKDVEIYWESDGGVALVGEQLRHGADLHVGPFRMSRAHIRDEHHISMPDPQLIGYISTVLPKSPNPDPYLPWQPNERSTDTWP
ncbi:hypothetical protein [Burkholderia vietnamiensis]|uniref:hypothetical protein n=1 Tax=Burkholderia vietnamiensis TaxID=60552 RepID=UPI001BA318C2|nr:hypothetical protein [Burkholderia vietnamiensis]MBR8279102.1 hypothetical protein [Burkholderia vietnamiensis]